MTTDDTPSLSRRQALALGVTAGVAMTPLAALAAGTDDYLGVGWYIRRTNSAPDLANWYGGVLRLPVMRGAESTYFFWGGNGLVMELKSPKNPAPQRYTDPMTAPMVPIWRTFAYDRLVARLRKAGARIVHEGVAHGDREAYVLDPDNQLVGFRQTAPGSRRPVDMLHTRDNARGGHFIPGVSMLPDDIYGWCWTRHHVPDAAAEVAFYRDAMGFPIAAQARERTVFDIGFYTGNGHQLEIEGNGPQQQLPASREDRTDAIIMRVANQDRLNREMKAKHVPIVDDHIQYKSTELTYVGTPSGGIIGFEQRYDPKDYLEPRPEYPEDAEAHRLWRTRTRG